MAAEALAFLGFAAAGAAAGVVFDILRALRRGMRLPAALTDSLFWILAAGIFGFSLIYFNGGRLRGYEVLGAAAGTVLYFFTISTPVVRCFTVIFKIFFKNLGFIFKILLTPPQFLYKILYKVYKRCSHGVTAVSQQSRGTETDPNEYKENNSVIRDE